MLRSKAMSLPNVSIEEKSLEPKIKGRCTQAYTQSVPLLLCKPVTGRPDHLSQGVKECVKMVGKQSPFACLSVDHLDPTTTNVTRR